LRFDGRIGKMCGFLFLRPSFNFGFQTFDVPTLLSYAKLHSQGMWFLIKWSQVY